MPAAWPCANAALSALTVEAALAKTIMVSRNIEALRLGRDGIHSTDKTFTIVHIHDRSARISDPCSAALLGSCDRRTICSRKYFDWRQSRASWKRFADSFMVAYSHFARRCRTIPDTSAACSALRAYVIRAADGCALSRTPKSPLTPVSRSIAASRSPRPRWPTLWSRARAPVFLSQRALRMEQGRRLQSQGYGFASGSCLLLLRKLEIVVHRLDAPPRPFIPIDQNR
jgi:hypothetical protein